MERRLSDLAMHWIMDLQNRAPSLAFCGRATFMLELRLSSIMSTGTLLYMISEVPQQLLRADSTKFEGEVEEEEAESTKDLT